MSEKEFRKKILYKPKRVPHTITEDTMQLIFGEEVQPINAVLLVLSEFSVNRDRDLKGFHF